jgi:hypothetical protein
MHVLTQCNIATMQTSAKDKPTPSAGILRFLRRFWRVCLRVLGIWST